MDNHKKRIRRTLLDFLLELVGLLTLMAFLWSIQTSAAVRQQQSNSLTKLNIARQRMVNNAEEAEDNLASYDAFSQAKVDTIAFYIDRNPDTPDLPALCGQWGLSGYCLLDAAGQITASSAPAAQWDAALFADALKTMSPLSLDDGSRYYMAALSNGGMLIGGRDVSKEDALLAELRSPAHALRTIRVGTTGYIFAVNEADGTLAYHPDDALIGASAAAAGYDPALYPDGFNGKARLGGVDCYCMSRTVNGWLLAAIVPDVELMTSAVRTTVISLLIFAVVISLLVIYALILRRDQDRHPPQPTDYRKVGKLYINRVVAGELRNVALIGLVAVFVVTFYMQTLAALSRQSMLSEAKLDSVEAILIDNSERVDELTAEYSAEYAQRAKNIAWTLARDATLIDDDSLAELADKAQCAAIYVFNRSGRVVATNTNYKDFVLSNVETDQSYPFRAVCKGYIDELVQDVTRDDTFQHNYVQYVGVKRQDANGMVELGLSPRRIANRLQTTGLHYVLSDIAVENDGMLFAVNKADGTFSSYPKQKYIGRAASQYGLTAAALVDGYTGMQTLDGVDYFLSGIEVGENIICTAVPLSTIYAQRMTVALWATAISLIIILLICCFLVFGDKPSEDVPKESEVEAQAASGWFFRMLQGNGRARVVQSAASRWNGTRQPWSAKTPEQKLISIAGIILSFAAIGLVAYLWLFDESIERGSILSYILGQRWERGFNLFSLTYSAIILLEVVVITGLVRRLLMFVLTRFGARSETIARLLDSFIKYLSVIGVIFYCMNAMGVDSAALLASAGILSLVVGLGAQSLIGDILAGIFIVFEGEFRVGDIVTIGDWRGTVLEIGIRTTKIESGGNDIKIFNNSSISGVINMTKQFSYAFADVGIEYGESLEHVESVLQKELPPMKERLPSIVNGPFYKGVASLGESSVNIRIVAQCHENDRIQLIRDMNRELKLIFDRHNISIPFPQVVVNQPTEHERATRKEQKTAESFVQEQKELTKDMPVHEDS